MASAQVRQGLLCVELGQREPEILHLQNQRGLQVGQNQRAAELLGHTPEMGHQAKSPTEPTPCVALQLS